MREVTVSVSDEGQRLDKFMFRYLSLAPSSFIYKMLRKKNIVLNDKKSDGKDILKASDVIKIYLAEETIEKFTKEVKVVNSVKGIKKDDIPPIVYEDENIIIINKPVGLLSQKAEDKDVSANEILIGYMLDKGEISEESLKIFKPSICNRLDRNTSGILIFAKNYSAANFMAKILKDRSINKYYSCIAKGKVTKDINLEGSLSKDKDTNKVYVSSKVDKNHDRIETSIKPLAFNDNISFLEVHLITGKTHQIRAHLSHINHPLIGDYKYGDRKANDLYKNKFGISSQLLCATRLVFPGNIHGKFEYLSGREFKVDIPDDFVKVCNYGNLEIKRS